MTYATADTHTATLTVTDSDNNTATDTASVTISAPLTADAGGPYSATEGVAFSLSGSASGGTSPYTYSWELDGTTKPGASPSYTISTARTYTATLTVTDSDNNTATDTASVTISAPLTADAGGPYSATEGVAFSLSGFGQRRHVAVHVQLGVGRHDQTRRIAELHDQHGAHVHGHVDRDRQRQQHGNGHGERDDQRPAHPRRRRSLQRNGGRGVQSQRFGQRRHVAVHVQLGVGRHDQTRRIAELHDQHGAHVHGHVDRDRQRQQHGNGHGERDDQRPAHRRRRRALQRRYRRVDFRSRARRPVGTTPYSYSWSTPDGTQSGSGASVSVTYATADTHTATLTVTDSDNNTATDTASVTISAPLTADAGGPYSATEGVAFSLSGSASGGTSPYTYSWELDGTTKPGASPSYTISTARTYTATLTVTDSDNNMATDMASVTISAPLTADAGGPYLGERLGEEFSLSGSASGGTSPYTYSWSLNGTTKTGASPSFIIVTAGRYRAMLTVTDSRQQHGNGHGVGNDANWPNSVSGAPTPLGFQLDVGVNVQGSRVSTSE